MCVYAPVCVFLSVCSVCVYCMYEYLCMCCVYVCECVCMRVCIWVCVYMYILCLIPLVNFIGHVCLAISLFLLDFSSLFKYSFSKYFT